MSHDTLAQQALDNARTTLDNRRADSSRLLNDVAEKRTAWQTLARGLDNADPQVVRAKSAYDSAVNALGAARIAERSARAAVVSALAQWLDADPAADVRTMQATYPLVLFPVRLQTRFDPPNAPQTLKVRIYPDDILSDTHEPELTAAESDASMRYWQDIARGVNGPEAWRRLLTVAPAPRAAYIVTVTNPSNPPNSRPGSRLSSWTRPAEARLLPDRWIVLAYRDGQEIQRVASNPVVEPLALTIGPSGTSGAVANLGQDPDVGWAFDFSAAVAAGMAVSIPLSPDDIRLGFDRLLVVGVKASLTITDSGVRLADLWQAHHYSHGLAFVAQGMPTHNTGDAPAGFPPDDPDGAKSYTVEFGTGPLQPGSDGDAFMKALGLPTDLAAHIDGGNGQEQAHARAMNRALWPATLGYFLETMMARGFDRTQAGPLPLLDGTTLADVLDAARTHFVQYVRGRGPYPAFRVGSTPYGLLPATSLNHWVGGGQNPVKTPDLVVLQVDPSSGGKASTEALRVGWKMHRPQTGWNIVLQAGTPLDLSPDPWAFLLTDWSHSGKPDLVAIHKRGTASQHTEVTILSGASGFAKILSQGPTSLPESDDTYAFAMTDWNGDGTPDLVAIHKRGTASQHTEVTVLSGASGFQSVILQATTVLPETDDAYAFALTDWDRDGTPDLFAVQRTGAASRHIVGAILSGASGFQSVLLHADTGVQEAATPLDISLADWDGDGVVDLVFGGSVQRGPFNVLYSAVSGASNFTSALVPAQANLPGPDSAVPASVHTPSAYLATDWDGDGRAELVVVSNAGTGSAGIEVTVLSGAPIAQWSAPLRLPDAPRAGGQSAAVAVADLNGDGHSDLVLLQLRPQGATIEGSYRIGWELDPSGLPGRWSPDAAASIPASFDVPTVGAGVGLADLDGDGRKELIVFHLDGQAGLHNNQGMYAIGWGLDKDGSVARWSPPFTVPAQSGIGSPGSFLGASMAVADLDGSGKPDLVLAFSEDFPLVHMTRAYYLVGRNLDGTGQIAGGWSTPIPVPGNFRSTYRDLGLTIDDIDGDGRPDLVLFYIDAAPGGRTAWYRIGWALDAQGWVQGGWTDPLRVLGWGATSESGGIALAHISRGGWIGFLRALREVWRRGVPRVPRVGRSDDLDSDLLRSLALDNSAREVHIRRLLGGNVLLNLYNYLGGDFFFQGMGTDWDAWYAAVQRRLLDVMRLLGEPAWDTQHAQIVWRPRVADDAIESRVSRFFRPFVAPAPLSEEVALPPVNSTIPNYIEWLYKSPPVPLPSGPPVSLKNGIPSDDPMPLLYYLLRHALLLEYARAAFQVDVTQGRAWGSAPPDPEFIGTVPSMGSRTVWDRLNDTVSVSQPIQVGQYLWQGNVREGASLNEHREALKALVRLPTAELDRLLAETLDICSHRLDAWVTSVATRRLADMRASQATGCYLGGFGWLEDVRPAPPGQFTVSTVNGQTVVVQNGNGGYIQAPSMSHASAAAILRNARLTRGGSGSSTYALDLSSERVRVARYLLDVVRAGQPLGAALGYRIERILHEQGLQKYIDPLRQLFPLVPPQNPDATAPAGSTAARAVIDGLALRARWPNLPWGQGDLPGDPVEQAKLHQALDSELGHASATSSGTWLDPLDAVADLLTAESVFQLVRGNTTAAVASLDALSQGVRAPDPEIARAPSHGTPLTHRVALILGDPPLGAGPFWPVATPRALADPYLDNWVGSLLGDPRQVKCRVSVLSGSPAAQKDLGEISLHDLHLCPLDVLALARNASVPTGASELDERVACAALGLSSAPTGADIQSVSITYARALNWAADVRSFPEMLEVADTINTVLGSAQPLQPADLIPPESHALASSAVLAVDDARSRAQEAYTSLQAKSDALASALQSASSDAATLRGRLFDISLHGFPAAIPRSAAGAGADVIQKLQDQAQSVQADVQRLLSMAKPLFETLGKESNSAATIADARDLAQTLFGRDMTFVTGFRPVEAQPGELAQALGAMGKLLSGATDSPANTLRKWFQGVARVRPVLDRWRKLALYAGALHAPQVDWAVAQLPYQDGERWVGLPFATEDDRPPAGRVSLVLNRPVSPGSGSTWAGLLLDEWTELIPDQTEQTGISLHYDSPKSQPPQTVLLAVSPRQGQDDKWDLDVLIDVLHETLELVHMRAVEGAQLGTLGQFLPAINLAVNSENDTVSTDFRPMSWQE